MRWTWLVIAVCLGCARPVDVDATDNSANSWVIQGTEPANLLLTNGAFGVWVNTATLQFVGKPLRMVDGRLIAVDIASPIPASTEAFTHHTWSFDMRSGELKSITRFRDHDVSAKIVLDPAHPVIAFDVAGGPRSQPRSFAFALAGEPCMPDEGKGNAFSVRIEKSSLLGVFASSEEESLPPSYAQVLRDSEAFHAQFWKTDIEIDGPAEDQLAIRTMLYYLRRGATDKLPPFGTSNAKYRGVRFWDAEAWMLPVLALVDRQKAEAATHWRTVNTGEYIPWEAANNGLDATPKEFGRALHVAGWVAWWNEQAAELGLIHPKIASAIAMKAMRQYLRAVEKTSRGYEIRNVESPDEGKLRNNDLVTNVLARLVGKWSMERSLAPSEDILPLLKVALPKGSDGLPLTYDDDPLKGYQQAAALLTVFPLDFFSGEVARKMFDRYAPLASDVGPAMSESIHATIAARLGHSDAYARWQHSWRTYTDDAMMFHERRLKDDAYFMTGAAGCLQTVVYGFAGMRIIPIPDDPVGFPTYRLNHRAVVFRPNLPREWKSLTLKNFWLGDDRINVFIDHQGVRIEALEKDAADGIPRRGP